MSFDLVPLHSVLRYVVLVLLVATLVQAYSGIFGKKPFTAGMKKLALVSMTFLHIQLLLGVFLYFVNHWHTRWDMMSDAHVRFFLVEHWLMMLLATILITVGYSASKRSRDDSGKYVRLATFYTLGIVLILVSIPWPFLKPWGTWF